MQQSSSTVTMQVSLKEDRIQRTTCAMADGLEKVRSEEASYAHNRAIVSYVCFLSGVSIP